MKKIRYQKQKLAKLKVAAAILCFVLAAVQISGIFILYRGNDIEFRDVPPSGMDYLAGHENITLTIKREDVLVYYPAETGTGEALSCMGVLTPGHKVLVITAAANSAQKGAQDMERMKYGELEQMTFRGRTNHSDRATNSNIRNSMTLNNIFRQYKLNDQDIHSVMVNIVEKDLTTPVGKLAAYAAIAMLLIVIGVWLLWKSFNNLIYGYLVDRGKIEPELRVKKEDIQVQGADPYVDQGNEGGSFYINHDDPFQIRQGGNQEYHFDEAAQRELQPEQPEAAKMRYAPDAGEVFYQSEVNEEGNFYVSKNNQKKTDAYGEDFRHY